MTATICYPNDDPHRAARDSLLALTVQLARLARERDVAVADVARLRAINADLRKRLAESELRERVETMAWEGCPNV